jgi:hypothetical protein
MDDVDTASLFFTFPDDIVITSVRATTPEVVLHIACRRSGAVCPLCQQPSERVHGHYGRTVTDLPCAGRRIVLALTVRKFVCTTSTCPRQIFTERLADLVQSYGRMPNRLREARIALGLATSAEVSERLSPALGMLSSAPTLLRHLRQVISPAPQSVHVLGVDDWAWKKGQTYGTILVDLQKRCPIELLPDRQADTLTAWLLTHPEIEVISRDRAGEYAAAAKKGAPQAKQSADSFPLVKNLRDGLKELMARKHKLLPEVEEDSCDGIPARAQGKQPTHVLADAPRPEAPQKHWRSMSKEPRHLPSSSANGEDALSFSQVSRANRYVRYEAVRALHQQAISKPSDCTPIAPIPANSAYISGRRVLSRAKQICLSRKPPRSLPALHSRALEGWVLEGFPAVRGSQSTWLPWLGGLVSSLHVERAQAASGSGNRGLARTVC